jgi:hypothetical protein
MSCRLLGFRGSCLPDDELFRLGFPWDRTISYWLEMRLYAFEWGEVDRILAGFGRDGQPTAQAAASG